MQPSEFGVQTRSDHGNGAAVLVVSRVCDQLVIDSRAPGKERQAVIGLDNLLEARMGKLPVANQNPKTARIQKRPMDG